MGARLTEARLQQRAKHDINIDISQFGMTKSARQSTDDLETELLPKVNRRCIGRDNKIELHRAEAKPTRLAERMLSHVSSHSQSARVLRDHKRGIRDVRAWSCLIRSQNVSADYFSILHLQLPRDGDAVPYRLSILLGHVRMRVRSKPISQRLFTRHPGIECIGVARRDNFVEDFPNRVAVSFCS